MSDMWPPMPQQHRKDAVDALREIARRVEAGDIYAFGVFAIDTEGRRATAFGASYNSDVAIMAKSFLENAMTCECGKPGCPTDLTRISAIEILNAYLHADNPPKKGN